MKELKVQFVEVGEWARHYSTVRATVSPVLAGLSLGILQFAIKQQGASKWIPAVSSLLLWLAALIILVAFTRSTRQTTRHWTYIQDLLFLHEDMKWDGKGRDYILFLGFWLLGGIALLQNP
jgi:hypothetical protein